MAFNFSQKIFLFSFNFSKPSLTNCTNKQFKNEQDRKKTNCKYSDYRFSHPYSFYYRNPSIVEISNVGHRNYFFLLWWQFICIMSLRPIVHHQNQFTKNNSTMKTQETTANQSKNSILIFVSFKMNELTT